MSQPQPIKIYKEHDPIQKRKAMILRGDIDAPASVIVIIITDHFKTFDWFNWEPDVLIEEIKEDFGFEMPSTVRDKIWGLVTALTTDLFYHDAVVFNHIANALSGGPTPMLEFEPAQPHEMAWAVIEVGMNDSDPGEQLTFGPEVQKYVGHILEESDLGAFPPLEWAETKTPPLVSYDEAVARLQLQDRAEKIQKIYEYLDRQSQAIKNELAACQLLPHKPTQTSQIKDVVIDQSKKPFD